MSDTKYGPQPALSMIKARGWTISQVADFCSVPYLHTRDALHGRLVPKPELREKVSALLQERVTDCFTPDSLSGPSRHRTRVLERAG
jgi:hypothetical protein